MKKVLYFFAVLLFTSVFTSCKKDDVSIPVDEDLIRVQVMDAPVPATDAFVAFAEGIKLKAGTLSDGPLPTVMVLPLDSRTIVISGTKATKYFLLYEFSGNARTKEITVSQQFNIKSDGNVDPTSGGLQEAIPGCPFKEEFIILGGQYYQNVTLSCNLKDGRQVTFNGQVSGNRVKLPPIEGGVWQLRVGFNDDDLYQEYLTYPINFYSLPREVKLKIEIKKDNIKSYIEIPKEYLVGAHYMQIFTEDVNTGEITSFAEFMPIYDETLPAFVLYGVPFEGATRVNIYSQNERVSLQVNPSLTAPINGKAIFRAKL